MTPQKIWLAIESKRGNRIFTMCEDDPDTVPRLKGQFRKFGERVAAVIRPKIICGTMHFSA